MKHHRYLTNVLHNNVPRDSRINRAVRYFRPEHLNKLIQAATFAPQWWEKPTRTYNGPKSTIERYEVKA